MLGYVFKLPKQLSSMATSYMMSRRQLLRNQTSPKADYSDFSKMLGFFYGDIVGLEPSGRVHLGFVLTSLAGGESAKEMSSTTPQVPPPLLRQ